MTSQPVYEELTLEECLTLLAETSVGRIAGIANGKPFVFPVNYLLEGRTVVFRTGEGTKRHGASFGQVAFEIDSIDQTTRTGWSVILHGVGHEISEALDHYSQHLRELDLHPWPPGEKPHWVAIHAESITGRRIIRRPG